MTEPARNNKDGNMWNQYTDLTSAEINNPVAKGFVSIGKFLSYLTLLIPIGVYIANSLKGRMKKTSNKELDVKVSVQFLKTHSLENATPEQIYNEGARINNEPNRQKKNVSQMITYYQIAADRGHAPAQFLLGNFYESGRYVKQNLEKAIYLYEQAANWGDAEAQARLGFCYLTGNGVTKNFEEAVRYLTLAANQGNSQAQYNLALCYAKGDGVKIDKGKALEFLNLAAKQNDNGYFFISIMRSKSF